MAFQTFDQWKQQTEPKVTTTVQSFDDWKKSTNPLNEGLLAPIGRAIQKVPESFVGGLAGKGIRNIGKSFEQLASSKGRQEFMQTNPIMQQFEKAGRGEPQAIEDLALAFTPMGVTKVGPQLVKGVIPKGKSFVGKNIPKPIAEVKPAQLPEVSHISDNLPEKQSSKNFLSSFVNRVLSIAQKPKEIKSGIELPSSITNVMNAIQEAKPVRGEQAKLYSAERAKRIGKVVGIGGKVPGEAGYHAQLGALKGELPKVKFEGIRGKVTQEDVDDLFNIVEGSELVTPFEKITAKNGLSKLLEEAGGVVPTKGELGLLNEIFPPELIKTILDKRSRNEKLFQLTGEVLNIPRSLMASTDLSAPLRQGLFILPKQVFTHPGRTAGTFKDMFKNFFSEDAYKTGLQEIQGRPSYLSMRGDKLSLTKPSEFLSQREEMFQSNLAEKIPIIGGIVRASNRAYTGFLNKMRADVYDDLVKSAQEQGVLDGNPDIGSHIANFVNTATGRGDLGRFAEAGAILNGAFFSPKLMFSRLNLLNPKYYADLDPFVRKEALKNLFATTGTGLTILGLASMAGAEVGTDPRSTDFGKIKVGNTRYDIWGGFQQYVRLAGQLITGEMVSSTTGKETKLGEGYKPPTRASIIGKTIEYKLAPVLSFAKGLLEGQDYAGQPLDIPKEVGLRFTPIVLTDMYDLYKEGGLKEVGLVLPTIFGVGTQTYAPKTRKELREKRKMETKKRREK